MAPQTHQQTVVSISDQDTAVVNVPVSEQRNQGISIDDEIEVTIAGLDGVFDSVSFTNKQIAGDQVTVPAEVARRADLEDREYDMTFEKVDAVDAVEETVEEVEETADSLDDLFEDTDPEAEEEAEELLDEMEDENEEAEEAEEEESEGLGELFS